MGQSPQYGCSPRERLGDCFGDVTSLEEPVLVRTESRINTKVSQPFDLSGGRFVVPGDRAGALSSSGLADNCEKEFFKTSTSRVASCRLVSMTASKKEKHAPKDI